MSDEVKRCGDCALHFDLNGNNEEGGVRNCLARKWPEVEAILSLDTAKCDMPKSYQPRKEKMMATKLNPGVFDCYDKAAPDEPMFVLLARDPLAPSLVRDWATARQSTRGHSAKVEEALACADAMEEWYSKVPR